MHSTQVMSGVHLHVRMRSRADVPSFQYRGNGLTDCAEIWYVVRDSLASRFTNVNGGVQAHARTCTSLLCILGTARRIALKYGVSLGDH